MNSADTLALIQELRRSGATHFKSQDFEVSFNLSAPVPIATSKSPAPETAPVENEEATQKLKDLIETLKLDDMAILDRVAPAGAGG